ncbi:MAG TPA: SDR family oxidoreductase [Xanthobacteraceae bacterium]|nr:SDR family oxidoreductase [Xanthobacteraceae bacterium]
MIAQVSGRHKVSGAGAAMELGLKGKVAVVTGASRGIGAGIARVLAGEGVDVLLVARDAAALRARAEEIKSRHQVGAQIFSADLREEGAASACVAAAVQYFGGIDILVNCAGATKRGDFFKLTEDDWRDGFALKFHGAARLARAGWPHLKARRGAVINIVGVGAHTPSAEFTIGGSVNSALAHFSKALADIGHGDGIRVNAIHPGYIETDRLATRIDNFARERKLDRDKARLELARTLDVTRFGTPEDIGRLVAFLASEASSYIHGAIIDIDEGVTKGM